MKLRQLVIAAFTLSSAVAFAHGNASKAMSDNSGDNSNISQVQQALNDKGFNPGPVDGKAGPKTKAALKQFQQSQGISASGQLDGQTLVALGVQSSSSTQGSNDRLEPAAEQRAVRSADEQPAVQQRPIAELDQQVLATPARDGRLQTKPAVFFCGNGTRGAFI